MSPKLVASWLPRELFSTRFHVACTQYVCNIDRSGEERGQEERGLLPCDNRNADSRQRNVDELFRQRPVQRAVRMLQEERQFKAIIKRSKKRRHRICNNLSSACMSLFPSIADPATHLQGRSVPSRFKRIWSIFKLGLLMYLDLPSAAYPYPPPHLGRSRSCKVEKDQGDAEDFKRIREVSITDEERRERAGR